MSAEQFRQGLRTIHGAVLADLAAIGVPNPGISQKQRGSGPRETTFEVPADKKQRSIEFTREEIEDSARTLDPFAATKVRMLVSQFRAEK